MTVNAPSGTVEGDGYDLFDPKPSTDGPTPLVNSIFIEIQDLPHRVVPGFDQPAFKPDIAENPGHYLVTGDYNGIIPILDVEVVPRSGRRRPAGHRPRAAHLPHGGRGRRVQHVRRHRRPLPDDRFTLFVNDEGIIDFAGNILDCETNADEPHDSPPGPGEPDVLGVDGVPTGDGLPGGDFFARFTVDTRPELAVWAAGTAFLDINGNTIWDPDNPDFTNRDITYMMGFTSDDLFAGKFATDDGDGGCVDDGFDKLGAYGRVGTTTFRWLIDTDNDGVPTSSSSIRPTSTACRWRATSASDLRATKWACSRARPGGSTRTTTSRSIRSHGHWPAAAVTPIVGDFDGDGLDDLGTWTDDTFSFDLSSINSAGRRPAGQPGHRRHDREAVPVRLCRSGRAARRCRHEPGRHRGRGPVDAGPRRHRAARPGRMVLPDLGRHAERYAAQRTGEPGSDDHRLERPDARSVSRQSGHCTDWRTIRPAASWSIRCSPTRTSSASSRCRSATTSPCSSATSSPCRWSATSTRR